MIYIVWQVSSITRGRTSGELLPSGQASCTIVPLENTKKGRSGQLIPQNTRYSAGLATLGSPLAWPRRSSQLRAGGGT